MFGADGRGANISLNRWFRVLYSTHIVWLVIARASVSHAKEEEEAESTLNPNVIVKSVRDIVLASIKSTIP